MRTLFHFLFLFTAGILLCSCHDKSRADLLVYHATIYTVNDSFAMAEAMAVRDGKVVGIGMKSDLNERFTFADSLDAGGGFIYPGFIDAHAHFYRYALGLNTVNLVATTSWGDVIERVRQFDSAHRSDGWIVGRGWDQNDWTTKEFPTKAALDQAFPNRPVCLSRIDGHAVIANQAALDLAHISGDTRIAGGEIILENGQPTGVLIDQAAQQLLSIVPDPPPAEIARLLKRAEALCTAAGLTTIDDCGIDYKEALFVDSLQKNGALQMRVYAMLSDNTPNFNWLFKNGKLKTERLSVRSFKVYADGALGSRGACLLHDYADKPGWRGFLLSTQAHFDSVAKIILDHGFQMCTHAIGDSANRFILSVYAKYLEPGNDRRWRIEHAQVIDAADFDAFGRYAIVPSVQPTHATSDMYWAGTRLGNERLRNAYAYRQLLQQNGWIPLGTDFPVEDISPLKTFFAAVFRTDDKGLPHGGFQMENALSPQDALRGITIWAARSNFEEKEKGSLEPGKFADFVLLDRDLLHTDGPELLQTKTIATYIGGKAVHVTAR